MIWKVKMMRHYRKLLLLVALLIVLSSFLNISRFGVVNSFIGIDVIRMKSNLKFSVDGWNSRSSLTKRMVTKKTTITTTTKRTTTPTPIPLFNSYQGFLNDCFDLGISLMVLDPHILSLYTSSTSSSSASSSSSSSGSRPKKRKLLLDELPSSLALLQPQIKEFEVKFLLFFAKDVYSNFGWIAYEFSNCV